MTATEPTKPRFYHPTPGKLVLGLLIIELVLLLIKPHSGWMVLTGIAIFTLTILVGLGWFGVALVFRRKFQFGIISLFGLMCVVAVVAAWFGWKMEKANKQKEAAWAIYESGGLVHYDYEYDADGTYNPDAEPPGPAWLCNLVGFDFLADVVEVNFITTQGTDAELEHLEGLTKLEWLNTGSLQITDAGLAQIQGLTNLKGLALSFTQVTDAGLEHLRGLTALEVLFLNYTQVGDAGLEHLQGLTRLEALWLKGTHVTEDGVKKLQQALPNCKIDHNFQ